MQQRLVMAVALGVAFAAGGEALPVASAAHPAVVRIIAPEKEAVSMGSGVLVAVTDYYGLVVTNWHVVCDAAGPLQVVFPDGFRSPARALKTDRDWDLAALAIRRPPVDPLPVAMEAPRPGDRLTIAGYGGGWYRTMSGRCTQYVSPGGNHGFEMVELQAPARNGDSGGPIFNQRGEVAGILFGSAFGRTTGSYCGRLRWFLSGVRDDFYGLPAPNDTLLARNTPDVPPRTFPSEIPRGNPVPTAHIPTNDAEIHSAAAGMAARDPELPGTPVAVPVAAPQDRLAQRPTFSAPPCLPTPPPAATAAPGEAWYESLRNFLAVVGITAVVLQGLKLLASPAR